MLQNLHFILIKISWVHYPRSEWINHKLFHKAKRAKLPPGKNTIIRLRYLLNFRFNSTLNYCCELLLLHLHASILKLKRCCKMFLTFFEHEQTLCLDLRNITLKSRLRFYDLFTHKTLSGLYHIAPLNVVLSFQLFSSKNIKINSKCFTAEGIKFKLLPIWKPIIYLIKIFLYTEKD